MDMRTRKVLAWLLALCMMVCMIPGNLLAEDEVDAPEEVAEEVQEQTEESVHELVTESVPDRADAPAADLEPTDAAPVTPEPEPTDESVMQPEPTEALEAEALGLPLLEGETLEADTDGVDYSLSILENPLFISGYVLVDGQSIIELFDAADDSAEVIATIESGAVGYLLERASSNPEHPAQKECVFIALVDGIQSFWIDGDFLYPMNEDTVAAYQEGLEEESYLLLAGSGFPLGIIEVEFLNVEPLLVVEALRIEPLWEGGFPEISGDSDMLDYSSSVTGETLRSTLRTALNAQVESVDLSSFSLTLEQLHAAYQALVDEDHSLFFVSGDATFQMLDGVVQMLFPSYLMNLDAHAQSVSSMQVAAASLVAQIPEQADTIALRVLSLHDSIVLSRTEGAESTAAAFLLDGRGNSHAAALALELVLNEAGIPAVSVRSETMGRVWNLVQVGGLWYHLDLFSDLQDTEWGAISYAHLLCSDQKVANSTRNHHGWEAVHAAPDTAFDELDWKAALLIPLELQLLHMGAFPEIETPPQLSQFGLGATIQQVMYTGIMAGESFIDVSSFGLSLSAFQTLFQNFLNDYPDLFFIAGGSVYYPGGTVYYLFPNYMYPKDVWSPMLASFQAYADKIISGVPSGALDLEKALYVYDFFALNFSYSASGNYSFDPYTLFMSKHGVCQAYSLAYKYVLNRMGVSSMLVTSVAMDHAWNLVMVDGSWYHVDATWGDPGFNGYPTIEGYVDHFYFLLSENGIRYDHYSYTPSGLATNTAYDSKFWRDLDKPFSYGNGYWFFVQNQYIRKWNGRASSAPVDVYELGAWGYFTSVAVYEGGLLFHDGTTLYNLPLSGGTPTPIYNPPLSSGRYVVGVFHKEDGLYYKDSEVYGGGYPIANAYRLSKSMLGIPYTEQEQKVVNFIRRIYQVVLNRNPAPKEEEAWMNDMLHNGVTGSMACEGFILSKEFIQKGISNRDFVTALYQVCFDRACAPAEVEAWSEYLDYGCSRRFVLNGFMKSPEFSQLCASYGISAGAIVLSDPADIYNNATMFVYRLYNVFLNRDPGWQELNAWTSDMMYAGVSGTAVAQGFAYSREFLGRNLPDREFIASIYEAMLGRVPSDHEIDSWINSLPAIGGRGNLYYQFVTAPEFIALMQSFGINP